MAFHSPKDPKKWVRIMWVAFQNALPGEDAPGYRAVLDDYARLLHSRTETTPILWEGKEKDHLARKTHVFERGNWLVHGKEVKPAVPAAFGKIPDKKQPSDRLELARWLVHRDNPLTARVMVNRLWEQLFGLGIVETVEDFGSQGSEPTHRALLDWLAVSYMEDDQWHNKQLLKKIVMSATYRQSSETDRVKQEKDPYNYWLARGPRVRLSAEQVRDQALAISGLLSPKMFGPSVMPPQPEGIWLSPYDGAKWKGSEGEDRYRRGLYTYWKRTAPYPSMTTFDAPEPGILSVASHPHQHAVAGPCDAQRSGVSRIGAAIGRFHAKQSQYARAAATARVPEIDLPAHATQKSGGHDERLQQGPARVPPETKRNRQFVEFRKAPQIARAGRPDGLGQRTA